MYTHGQIPSVICYHCLPADASSFGLSGASLQAQPSGERRSVAFAWGAMMETEQGYSQTAKEALATTWVIQLFDEFVRGIKFHVETDHLALVSLFGNMELDMLPTRIQWLRIDNAFSVQDAAYM